jgi:hypothetical protein
MPGRTREVVVAELEPEPIRPEAVQKLISTGDGARVVGWNQVTTRPQSE